MQLSNGAAVMAGTVILMSPFGSAQGDDRGRSVCAIMGLALVFLAVAFFFNIKEAAAQGALEKISISYPSVSSTGGVVLWIAKERGFFTAHGVDAELILHRRRHVHTSLDGGQRWPGFRQYLRSAERDCGGRRYRRFGFVQ
jgi:hypothetical protein